MMMRIREQVNCYIYKGTMFVTEHRENGLCYALIKHEKFKYLKKWTGFLVTNFQL